MNELLSLLKLKFYMRRNFWFKKSFQRIYWVF